MGWSIYQRRTDRLWVAVTELGVPGGKRRRRYLYAKTKAALIEKLKRDEGPKKRLSLATLLDDWLLQEASRKQPKTYDSYRNIVRRHLIPGLGAVRLDRLTPDAIDAYLREKLASGLSARTVEQHHEVLANALRWAEKRGKLVRNPARLVTPPSPPKLARRVLTPKEARKLLDAAKGERLEALFTVALSVGLREGEVLGLRWEDVDFQAGTITVRQALQRLHGETRFKEPKSAASRRLIYMPDVTKQALLAHRERQETERQAAGERWQEHGLVFTDRFGAPLKPGRAIYWLRKMLARAGLWEKLRFHDLRHSCASLLLAQGVHPRVVMELLGHSTITLTMDLYSHVIPAVSKEAARQVDALLSAAPTAVADGQSLGAVEDERAETRAT